MFRSGMNEQSVDESWKRKKNWISVLFISKRAVLSIISVFRIINFSDFPFFYSSCMHAGYIRYIFYIWIASSSVNVFRLGRSFQMKYSRRNAK